MSMTPLFIALVAVAGAHLHRSPLPRFVPAEGPAEGGAALPPPLPAGPIKSEVMLILGTNDNSGIDARLAKMPALSKPPFSAYNSYRLISRNSKPLSRGQASLQQLPNGRELRVTYKDALPQKAGSAPRYLLSASIETPNGRAFLPLVEVNAKAGEWFWLGGQQYQGGSLFVGIRAVPQ
jgi:hypothetical protein